MEPSGILRKVKIFYHKRCPDGVASAYGVWKYLGAGLDNEVAFIPIASGSPLDKNWVNRGDTVVMVDCSFSYKDVMYLLDNKCSVTVIDHHESARRNLGEIYHPNFKMYYEHGKAGCRLVWQYYHQMAMELDEAPRMPRLFELLEKYDLWRRDEEWHLARAANLGVVELCGNDFRKLMTIPFDTIITVGSQIMHRQDQKIKELISRPPVDFLSFDAYESKVPVYEIPGELTDECLHTLLHVKRVAPCVANRYERTSEPGKYKISLRARIDGPNVAQLAGEKGGGGHPQAAGFRL